MGKKWYQKGPVGAVYKAAKDTVAEINRAPIIGDVARPISQTISKAGGDISGEGKRVGGYISGSYKKNILAPVRDLIGGAIQQAPEQGGTGSDYSKYKLNLVGEGQAQPSSSLISGAEDIGAAKASIGQQYSAAGQLAKLREGSQRQSEQSAMARRLAASGMGASGAGMRMQQQAEQQAGRRSAETQLGLSAEQARAEQGAEQAAMQRNLQRESMRVGASESEAERDFRERQFKYQQDKEATQFAREGEIIAENQRIARSIQRYNERGLMGQLLGDLFGGGAYSMKYPLGQR
jgi:hypothetical protein